MEVLLLNLNRGADYSDWADSDVSQFLLATVQVVQ